MSTKDFTANVISATKVVPDGNFKDSKASGIWDINEALDLIKGGNWPNVANINPASFVDGLFQTHLYNGNEGTQTITNNVDLTKGGLVWLKRRDSTQDHGLFDTERGAGKYVQSNGTDAEASQSTSLTSFNSDGFTLGSFNLFNDESTRTYVSWTFRKQPKFFDVVKYTGNGNSGHSISHSLGSVPGMIIVKNLDDSSLGWRIWHRSLTNPFSLSLNSTGAANSDAGYFTTTDPTSSVFYVGDSGWVNQNNSNFIAYVFAHNNNDGGFGAAGDQDIIKCGSYTGNNSTTGPVIDLGFEPQWIFIKHIDAGEGGGESSFIFDNMRGVVTGGNDNSLSPNASNDEQTSADSLEFNASGFQLKRANSSVNGSSKNYIYMAIRRGGMQTPTAGTDVFAIDARTGLTPEYVSGFPVDFALVKDSNSSSDWIVNTRVLGNTFLETNTNVAEASDSLAKFDIQNGIRSDAVAGDYAWMWKRARGYFDVCCYTGNNNYYTSQNVAHNLGVVPEMIWIKNRDRVASWAVYNKTIGAQKKLDLDGTSGASANDSAYFNNTTPTSSVFTVGNSNRVNQANESHVAYLFATVAGVSKVGNFTMVNSNGSLDVDCGFTKFIILKRTNDTGHWLVVDTDRGITSGNDPYLRLDVTNAQNSSTELVNALSAGFTVQHNQGVADGDYIFYAIATDPS